MSHRPIDESDVIDALLGQAGPEVRDRVQAEVRSNSETAAQHELWARTLPALRGEREHAKAISGRVRERVMARLMQEDRAARADVPLRRSRFGVAAGLVATACAVALLVLFTGLGQHSVPPGNGPTSKESVSVAIPAQGADQSRIRADDVTYVVQVGEIGDRSRHSDRTFSDWAEAIEAVPAGGVLVVDMGGTDASISETPRLTKPMRIEARGGPVRFGLDPDQG
jgi:hypothetical protein